MLPILTQTILIFWQHSYFHGLFLFGNMLWFSLTFCHFSYTGMEETMDVILVSCFLVSYFQSLIFHILYSSHNGIAIEASYEEQSLIMTIEKHVG